MKFKNHPAFPTHEAKDSGKAGISTLDYFAAQAMQALVDTAPDGYELDYDDIAKSAYKQAKAMMRERQT
ncbi:hypothetical protein UFOVP24_48 [uncultured Caudovirales phage]|uniref:Uncharacterized protein n=1 Tax=uncultured Caudovirales phage TaxID=2100421 RepID=A0A6J5T8F8_9CAUD|nr:hypothetical protein UFOVP24_48 [uncultured Caudovirales phage]